MTKQMLSRFKWRIDSHQEATHVVRQSGYAFLLLALFKALLAFFLLRAALLDAAVYAVLALALILLRSRLIALTLLALTAFAFLTLLLTRLGPLASGGRTLSLTLVAARAVYATCALHGYPSLPLPTTLVQRATRILRP